MIYALKGWTIDTGDGIRVPDAGTLTELIVGMADTLKGSDRQNVYTSFGRLLVYKDSDYPSYFGVALELGLIPREITETGWTG